MFTGIIQAVGRVAKVEPAGQSVMLRVAAAGLDISDVRIGDSIACNGVCLTVTSLSPGGFTVDVSQETLRVSAGFAAGISVNLEKSLRLSDRLGGHLVSGHVDGVGIIAQIKQIDASREMWIRFPSTLGRYIARKGSIAVNGVSLTVNAVADDIFSLNLIPHTLAVTSLQELNPGDPINLEIDLIARYVERMLEAGKPG